MNYSPTPADNSEENIFICYKESLLSLFYALSYIPFQSYLLSNDASSPTFYVISHTDIKP
jgi:hypothetical protein